MDLKQQRNIALAMMAAKATDENSVGRLVEVYNGYSNIRGPIAAAILAIKKCYESPEWGREIDGFFTGLAEKCN